GLHVGDGDGVFGVEGLDEAGEGVGGGLAVGVPHRGPLGRWCTYTIALGVRTPQPLGSIRLYVHPLPLASCRTSPRPSTDQCASATTTGATSSPQPRRRAPTARAPSPN